MEKNGKVEEKNGENKGSLTSLPVDCLNDCNADARANSLVHQSRKCIPCSALKVQNLDFQFLVLSIKLPIPRSALKVHEHLSTIIKLSIPRFSNKIANSSRGPESARPYISHEIDVRSFLVVLFPNRIRLLG